MKPVLWMLAAFSALLARAADQVPRFNAVLTLGQEHRFVLISATGKASPWLKLGDTFENFTLKSYDGEATVLGLEQAGKITRVAIMPDAEVKPIVDATPTENRRVLESFVTRVPATGFVESGGGRALVIHGKHVLVGTRFVVHYQEHDYGLELVGVTPVDFSVRFRGEQFTYPIRPSP